MTNSVIETFSFPIEKHEAIKRAKEIAKRNGISFSKYIIELIEQDQEQDNEKKVNPLNLNQTKTLFGKQNNNTLDVYLNPDKHILSKEIHQLSSKEKLYTIRDNAYAIRAIAQTRLNKLIKNNII